MYLSRLELINKCNQNIAVPTINIPKPRQFKVVFGNVQNKPGKFSQISINATVEAFIFTSIQRWEHKIAKPTVPEWKEVNERSSIKARMVCLHARMFTTCLITCLSIKQYQFTGRDMPQQKSSGVAILVSLQECWVFLLITVHRKRNPGKPQVKIRFAFFERYYLNQHDRIPIT